MRKEYQIVINVEVDIHEITPELVDHNWDDDGDLLPIEGAPRAREEIDHNRSLLQALTEDPVALDRLLRKWTLAFLEDGLLVGDLPDTGDEREIIYPLVDRLDPEAQRFFRKAIQEEAFVEATEPFSEAIRIRTRGIFLKEA